MKKIIALVILFVIVFAVFLYGAAIYPHSSGLPSGASLEAPSGAHWLGTDNLGVDIYAQISSGFFHSIIIGIATAFLAFLIGGIFGVAAGLAGGAVDTVVEFLINVFMSIPQLPIMIVVGAFFGQRSLNIICIIAAFSWAPIAKQVRARTMSIRKTEYIILAKSYGGSLWYIFKTHMCREVMPLLIIGGVGVIGRAIVQEASLAFLGLSDPLARSWGLMISRCVGFKGIYFTDYWKWWLVPPVLSLVISVVVLRMLARELESYFLKQ